MVRYVVAARERGVSGARLSWETLTLKYDDGEESVGALAW